MPQLVNPQPANGKPQPPLVFATPTDLAAYIVRLPNIPASPQDSEIVVELSLIRFVKTLLAEPKFLEKFGRTSGKYVWVDNDQRWAVEIAYLIHGNDPDPDFGALDGHVPDPAFLTH